MSVCLASREFTARAAHQCDECGTEIAVGTRYVRQRNVSEGEAYTYKAHPECLEVARAMDTDWALCELGDPHGIKEFGGPLADVVLARIYPQGVQHG